jgi:hypothetical protein
VIGRILTLYMPHVGKDLPQERERQHLVPGQAGRAFLAGQHLFAGAISPLSTTALFTPAGMAHESLNVLWPRHRHLGDAWVIITAKVTADQATDLMRGEVSWQAALTAE